MSKKVKVYLWIIIVIITSILLNYRNIINDRNMNRVKQSKDKKINVTIIDKNNQIEKLHEEAEKEEYIQVDVIINGKYYYNVGLRTKGYSTYEFLRRNGSDQFSYKIKLDYKYREQRYERNCGISFKYTCYRTNKNKRIFNI